ncbi:toxin [Kitasatospora sp. NPDC088783]|uniref:toxin n=1 Tax=Kitasatospora sp. NPDC088783 TaxID=3364077 RepID=UPI0037F7A11C
MEGLIANIERVRGRRIFLVPIDAWEPDVTTACGLRVWTPDASFLFFRPRPTEYQTRHIILHEIVHEWLEHGESLDTQESQEVLSAQLQAFLEQQGVGPLVQARTSSYANLQEQQAEVGASWVKYMAQTRYQEGEDPYGRLVMSLSRPMAPPLRFRG